MTYITKPLTHSPDLHRELRRISQELKLHNQIEVLNAEPEKPKQGLLVYADGTNWNPGSGAGLYVYSGSAWVSCSGGGGGTSDHGALTGLTDDDHSQYHNDTRGDARYYTKTQIDTSLSGKSDTSHTHTHADVTDYDTELAGTTNTTAFTPTSDYHPATKKYVDDEITGAGGYNDEAAQDAVGTILTDSSEIDFTYSDATPSITASIVAGSIDETKLDASVNASLDLADSALQSYTETSHADVVVDGDFASEGLMKRGASGGTYSIVTDNSANWNTAYGWGDHSGAYLPITGGTLSGSLIMSAGEIDGPPDFDVSNGQGEAIKFYQTTNDVGIWATGVERVNIGSSQTTIKNDLYLSEATPRIWLDDTNASADQRYSQISASDSFINWRLHNDAQSVNYYAYRIGRSGEQPVSHRWYIGANDEKVQINANGLYVDSKLHRQYLTPADEGAAGDGTTDDTTDINQVISNNPGRTVYGEGKTYKVTAIPDCGTTRFVDGYWRVTDTNSVDIDYPMHGTLDMRTQRISLRRQGGYSTWPQDKFCSYKSPLGDAQEIVLAGYVEASGHGTDDMHLVIRRSDDGGNTWTDEEHYFDDDPNSEGSVWSMGIIDGRLFVIVRYTSGGSNSDHKLWSKRLYERQELTSVNVSATSGSTSYTLTINNHGLMAGDTFNIAQFSATIGGTQLSGTYTVTSVTDQNTIVITDTAASSTESGSRDFYWWPTEGDFTEIQFSGNSISTAINNIAGGSYPNTPIMLHGFSQDRDNLAFYVGIHGGSGNANNPHLIKVSNPTLTSRSVSELEIAGSSSVGGEPVPAVLSNGDIVVTTRGSETTKIGLAFYDLSATTWDAQDLYSDVDHAIDSPAPIRVAPDGEILMCITDTRYGDGQPGFASVLLYKWDNVTDFRTGWSAAKIIEVGKAYFSNTNFSDGANAVGVPSMCILKNGRVIVGYSSEHAPLFEDDDGQPSVYVVTIDGLLSGNVGAYDQQGIGGDLQGLHYFDDDHYLVASNDLSDLADAATARTNLGVDAAGTDNSTDVTLAGETYLSLSGQQITADKIAVGEIDATGTPSSSTYLRGDGAWETPDGGGGAFGSGTSVTFFQVADDGTTGQTTTGSFATLAGMWATPTQTDSDFSWVGSTGILTVNTTGTLELNINVMSHQSTGNNRTQLEIRVTKNGTGTVLIAAENYSQRNGTQDKGGCSIPGFVDSATATDTYRIQVRDIGTAVNVGSTFVPGETYISAKLYT